MGIEFVLVLSVVAWIVGALPFGLFVSRGLGENVGRWSGVLTFSLNCLKGVLIAFLTTSQGVRLIVSMFGLSDQIYLTLEENSELQKSLGWALGLIVVLGHCYSPFLKFKGGKGVATAAGVLLILSPWSVLLGVCAFALAYYYQRIVSLASISGVLVAAFADIAVQPLGVHHVFGAALILLILARHESNVDALLEDREKPFSL